MPRVCVDFSPEFVRKVHYNRFGSAADYHPLEGDLTGRINLLVRKPRRNIEEISRVQRCVELPSLAPANIRRAAEDVGDSILLSMVMDSRSGFGFDEEKSSPNRRF